tara:strand:- start:20010 stop:20267 length:258 start_codon:yes stop_codon:yes gene_type:complete
MPPAHGWVNQSAIFRSAVCGTVALQPRSYPMAIATHNRFRRFFSAAAQSINFASQADRLANTPESVFVARGTTRQQAIQDLLNGM